MVCAISSIPSTSRATDAREVSISDTSDELRRRNGNVLPSPAGCQRVSENLLDISNLHVEYPSLEHTVHAVRGCDLSVRKGEVMGLVGESGSGKSMTALACLGLVPPPGRVTGSVRLDGLEVIGASEANN